MATTIPNYNPIVNSPVSSPFDNIYFFEFTSTQSMALLASVLLNVVLIYNFWSPHLYAKVDVDDQKL